MAELSSSPKAQARLYCILARDAPVAVIFRRGPNKRVLLLLWRTDTDQFYEGQWLKGRIYERRCDLSPNGTRLIYFAANYKRPYFSWTAVSRPPFLQRWRSGPKATAGAAGACLPANMRSCLTMARTRHNSPTVLLCQGVFRSDRAGHMPVAERTARLWTFGRVVMAGARFSRAPA